MEQLYSHVVDWRELYRAAQLETNIPELFKLVEISEASLLLRRDELKAAEASGDELWEIERALQNLIIIKRERLYFRGQVELDCKKFTSPDSDRKKQMIESLREMLEILSESPQEAMYCERCGLPL